jgi:fermentation-respiration switch protein FrsA (DUF1100 family)
VSALGARAVVAGDDPKIIGETHRYLLDARQVLAAAWPGASTQRTSTTARRSRRDRLRRTRRERPMTQRVDIAFTAEGGVTLRGWLYLPEGPGLHPAITMAHGYAAVKEHGLERFAEAFAADGFVVLVHDHRTFGASDGTPRQDVDPWQQIADWRRAVSFLESRPQVDAGRIGLWGTSYAGGHAIVLAATDRRLRCVVAHAPTISGYEQGLRRVPPDAVAGLEEALAEDERAQFRGEPPRMQAIVSDDPAVPAAYRAKDAIEFYLQPVPTGVWENQVTVRSTRAARMYEPDAWISRVSPTPLLLVVADHDAITVTHLALAAYERALEPKKLALLPGGHFDPYLSRFGESSAAARDWFRRHLS